MLLVTASSPLSCSGAPLENRLRPTSDVNLLILVNRFDPTRVDTLRPTLQQGRAAVRLAVMWLTQDELPAAGESFSVKFADIVRRHRVLYGNDPFDRFTVSRHAAIARVRQVLLNLVLRLRASYALESDREERLAHLIADAAGPLRASAAEILDLQGTPASNGRAALELLARQWSPTKASMVTVSISQARETRRLENADTARVFLEVIDSGRPPSPSGRSAVISVMNPFDLRGPDFLAFYLVFGLAMLAVLWLLRRAGEADTTSHVMLDDYVEIAYLRGGPQEAMRVATLNLVNRGLLEVHGDDQLQAADKS